MNYIYKYINVFIYDEKYPYNECIIIHLCIVDKYLKKYKDYSCYTFSWPNLWSRSSVLIGVQLRIKQASSPDTVYSLSFCLNYSTARRLGYTKKQGRIAAGLLEMEVVLDISNIFISVYLPLWEWWFFWYLAQKIVIFNRYVSKI